MRPSFSIAVGQHAVRGIVPSLDGREVVAVLGENRRWFSPSVWGAALLRIEGEQLALGQALPFATDTMFALGGGEVAAARVEHNEVALLRPAGATPLIRGMSLLDVAMMLAPDGGEFRVRATERDDGHGWTEPVYTQQSLSVSLDGSKRVAAPWFRALRGAGSPALAPLDGVDDAVLDSLLKYLPYPFLQERPVCLGPHLLVTAARVIDVRSGETLIGQSTVGHHPPRDFFDLSADETSAAAADADGTLALWDVPRRTVRRVPEVGETRCAAFVGDRLLVGGADGRVHLLS